MSDHGRQHPALTGPWPAPVSSCSAATKEPASSTRPSTERVRSSTSAQNAKSASSTNADAQTVTRAVDELILAGLACPARTCRVQRARPACQHPGDEAPDPLTRHNWGPPPGRSKGHFRADRMAILGQFLLALDTGGG